MIYMSLSAWLYWRMVEFLCVVFMIMNLCGMAVVQTPPQALFFATGCLPGTIVSLLWFRRLRRRWKARKQ